jgi:Tol biopolymer transport system component
VQPGDRVSHYRIVDRIGAGGMGVVYRADDPRLGRPVAIKVLPAGALDEDAVARFRREARAASALNHPHICTVYDVGDHNGAPFLVLEFLEGETLADRLRRGPLPVDQALDLIAQVSDALATAHAAGIVHRDIKPGNLFITRRGDAKVLDFGLAKHADALRTDDETRVGSTQLTVAGTTMGTVAYMSPEQARAEAVDARSDLFSLGVVLYEALTGTRPFDGSSPAVIFSNILTRTPPAPSALVPQISADIDRTVLRALEKDRELRYQTAADLRADLRRLRHPSGGAGTVTVPPATRRGGRWWTYALGGTAIVAIAAAAIAWHRASTPAAPPSVAMRQLTSSGSVALGALSPDGRLVAYVEQRQDQQHLLVRQLATGSSVAIAPATPLTYSELMISADGTWVYAVRDTGTGGKAAVVRVPVIGGEPRVVVDDVLTGLALSPDGQYMLFARRDANSVRIFLASPDGTGAREVARNQSVRPPVVWSPDRREVAAAGRAGDLRVLAIESGDVATVPVPGWKLLDSVFWAPDGTFVVSAEPEEDDVPMRHQLVRVARDGTTATRLTNDLNDYHGISFSRDGSVAVAVHQVGTARLFLSEGDDPARLRPLTRGRGEGTQGLGFLDDGRLLYGDQLTEGWVMREDGSDLKPLPLERRSTPNVRPCGPGKVVFHRIRSQGTRVFVGDLATGTERQVGETSFAQTPPVCTPDGQFVIFGGPGLKRVAVSGGTPVTLAEHEHIAEVSPDGALIAFHGPGERLSIASAVDGSNVRPIAADAPRYFRWLPSGRAIVASVEEHGVDNLWELPLDGGPRKRLTDFTEDGIFNFVIGPDGRYLISRGRVMRDLVLMRLAE